VAELYIGTRHAAAITVITSHYDSVTVRLPILLGGGLMILLAAFLALTMTEEGFTPTPPEDRTTWGMMLKTVWNARQMVRRQPFLLALLGMTVFHCSP
jgi:hypothetical protein